MKTRIYICTATLILFVCSCDKNFGDLNIDPNNSARVNPEYLLTHAQKLIAENTYTGGVSSLPQIAFAEFLSQSWTQNAYTELSRYLITGDHTNNIFVLQYAGILYDLQTIEKLILEFPGGDATIDNNKIAVAALLRIYSFQVLTDLFGPIPYEQSLQGNQIHTPEYQSQKDIYYKLIEELEETLTKIDEKKPGFGSGDVIYQGDMARWKKFGHTLMCRIALRMSDVEQDQSGRLIEKTATLCMTSNLDNAYFSFLKSAPNNNPLYQQRLERGNADQGLSNILIDRTLKPLNDPRLPVWAERSHNSGEYFGRPFGQSNETATKDDLNNYSNPSGAEQATSGGNNFRATDILRPDFNAALLTYAEFCFMMAEASERGWAVNESAEEWYNKGIVAALNEWSIDDQGIINNYLQQPEVSYTTASGNWKQKIGVQKWLALFMQGFQAWIEWRRLDFEKLEKPAGGALGDLGNEIAPMRLVYPVDEQSLNITNYLKALQLLGGPDKLNTKVWWDAY